MTLSKSLQEVIQNELASLTVSVNGLVEKNGDEIALRIP